MRQGIFAARHMYCAAHVRTLIKTLLIGCMAISAAAATAAPVVAWSLGRLGQDTGSIANPVGTVSRLFNEGGGLASTAGAAEYGWLKASAQANVGPSGATYARSTARFQDSMTIDSAGLVGQTGYATVFLSYHWSLTFSDWDNAHASSALAHLLVGFGSSRFYAEESYVHSVCETGLCPTTRFSADFVDSVGNTIYFPHLDPRAFSVVVPISFGNPLALTAELDVQATAYGWETGILVDADAFNSMYWGGIAKVTDAFGNEVDFTARSISGTDYRASFIPADPGTEVPEPATWILAISAIAGITFSRRRGLAMAKQSLNGAELRC